VLAFLRSHFRDSIRSVTHKTQVPDLRRRTARRRVGMRFVAAQSVGEPTVRMPVFASGRERNLGCPSRYDRSSSTRSMPASHSGQYCAT
jgi:hypothetical protein